MELELLGWNDTFQRAFEALYRNELQPARIASAAREIYRAIGRAGEVTAHPTGRLRASGELPTVGDWVAIRPHGDGSVPIEAVLPRRTSLGRRAAGRPVARQVVAANVDTVVIVTAADRDLNPRRLERMAAHAWDAGAEPVILINKCDLGGDTRAAVALASRAAPGVPVLPVSAHRGDGIGALDSWLGAGTTLVLIGSSGVGKSTLANRLLGDDHLATGAIREADHRGRHTTTRRELLMLPQGAVLIDTPGIRELGVWLDGDGLDSAFPEVEELAGSCRYRDCRHEDEPGCAIRDAVEQGRLEAERVASLAKLRREAEVSEARRTPSGRHQQRRRDRVFARLVRDAKRLKE